MRPMEELVGLDPKDPETPLETLLAELAERKMLWRSPQGLLGVVFGDPAQSPEQKRLEREITKLEFEIWRRQQWDPIYQAGYRAAKADRAWEGAWAANLPWLESKFYCQIRAAEIWGQDPSRRIGQVSEDLLVELVANRLKAPESAQRVTKWLKAAAKDGQLDIPPQARRGGRPRSS